MPRAVRRFPVGLLDTLFGGRKVEHYLRRSRERLAAGRLEDATRVIEAGLERFPGAHSLREVQLAIRRTQARDAMRDLKGRIEADADPIAFEQLIKLYRETEMPAEALRAASQYAAAHPDSDTPHLLIGEMYLGRFFEDIDARSGLRAHQHLRRARQINPDAVKPLMLLAELYYCVDAPYRLAVIARDLRAIGAGNRHVSSVLEVIEPHCDASGERRSDSHFERIEVEGVFPRDPTTWPLRTHRNNRAIVQVERAKRAAHALVAKKAVEEVAVLRANGSVIAYRGPSGAKQKDKEEDPALVSIARHVSSTVSKYAREFDLGAFKRCTVLGPEGHLMVGRVGNVVAGARARTSVEAGRVWERVRIQLEGALKGEDA